jgi:alanine racemase
MSTPLNWVEIDLSAIRGNTRRLVELAEGAGLMAVVKANAYGHGAAPVARAAAEAGAAWLGVARPDEALALRAEGLRAPILVLGYTPPELAHAAIWQELTLAVFDLETAAAYAAAARAQGHPARVHAKLDTGMGRLGVAAEDGPAFVQALHGLEGLEVDGLFTHLAASDMAGTAATLAQLARFDAALQALAAAGLRPRWVHAANSAGVMQYPDARYDLVRSGIAMYGLDPSDEVPCPPGFTPALTWKARVMQVKTLPPGHGVSYGAEYVTTTIETVAVAAAGYADGFRRVPKGVNEVLVGGQRRPVRGRVCMDQVVVGVAAGGDVPGVRMGDEVVLLGRQGDETISAADLARRWGTINYDVTSGIMARVERLYQA